MTRISARTAAALLTLVGSFRATAQCAPEWLPPPPDRQLNGPVNAFGTFRGDLVAGGDFTEASGQPAGRVARWDGAAWDPLGTGVDNSVYAIQEFDGRLIVGGVFQHAGGRPASGVAAWDGSTWQPLGAGLIHVYALTEFEGELFAGGALRVARWNGTEWSQVGTPPAQWVEGLCVVDGHLVAAGTASCGFECFIARVDRWDGAVWEPMGVFPPGFMWATASTLLVDGGTLYAGVFNVGSLVHRWDGAGWPPLGVPPANWWGVRALATYRGDLVAAAYVAYPGTSSIARWNGVIWVDLGNGLNDHASALAHDDDVLVVGGAFTTAGGLPSPFVARWGCACYPDCNDDNDLTVADFGCFQTQFVAGEPYADCTNDGVLTVHDFGCFQTRFVQGCP